MSVRWYSFLVYSSATCLSCLRSSRDRRTAPRSLSPPLVRHASFTLSGLFLREILRCHDYGGFRVLRALFCPTTVFTYGVWLYTPERFLRGGLNLNSVFGFCLMSGRCPLFLSSAPRYNSFAPPTIFLRSPLEFSLRDGA